MNYKRSLSGPSSAVRTLHHRLLEISRVSHDGALQSFPIRIMRKRFHGLKKVVRELYKWWLLISKSRYTDVQQKLRQSWNKYNLYNLSRAEAPNTANRTFYQQKWSAKSLTRAYHGETLQEKKWQRMFRPYIRSVVPMDHTYLGKNDGSDEAAGRGSGKDVGPDQRVKKTQRTPYMNMVYAELERRLDTAIFRALFASSTRQARQFVVHGCVKVNGKKVRSLDLFPVPLLMMPYPDDLSRLSTESRRHVPSRA